jgi:hypothetical protein
MEAEADDKGKGRRVFARSHKNKYVELNRAYGGI